MVRSTIVHCRKLLEQDEEKHVGIGAIFKFTKNTSINNSLIEMDDLFDSLMTFTDEL